MSTIGRRRRPVSLQDVAQQFAEAEAPRARRVRRCGRRASSRSAAASTALRHVADVDRLEAGVARDHRHEGQHPRQAGEAVEELVLRPEHDGGAEDGRRREGRAHRRFAFRLGAAVGAGAVRVGADGRDVDQPLDSGCRRQAGDAAGAFGVERAGSRPRGARTGCRPGSPPGRRRRPRAPPPPRRRRRPRAARSARPCPGSGGSARRPGRVTATRTVWPARARSLHHVAADEARAAEHGGDRALVAVRAWFGSSGLGRRAGATNMAARAAPQAGSEVRTSGRAFA